jgi:PAS domain S-box-containing protein
MNEFSAAPKEPPPPWRTEPAAVLLAEETAELNRTRRALAANETLLHQFVQHTPAAVAMFDTQMRCLQASDRWLTDYGLAGRNIVGLSCHEMFPGLPDRWKEVYHHVLAGATEQCERDPIQRLDGSVEWVQWEARPWHEPDGPSEG